MPSWRSTESWRAPRRRVEWSAADEWSRSFKAVVTVAVQRLDRCLFAWDRELDDIGGDRSREDWALFRPLRLSREEDWSNWLGHLLASSRTGRFPARLLGGDVRHAQEWRVRSAEREKPAESYRADLVVKIFDGRWVHVEVKIGDLDLAKTPGTTQALRSVIEGGFRGDYLLLPAADVSEWEDVKKGLDGADTITEGRSHQVRSGVFRRVQPVSWQDWWDFDG